MGQAKHGGVWLWHVRPKGDQSRNLPLAVHLAVPLAVLRAPLGALRQCLCLVRFHSLRGEDFSAFPYVSNEAFASSGSTLFICPFPCVSTGSRSAFALCCCLTAFGAKIVVPPLCSHCLRGEDIAFAMCVLWLRQWLRPCGSTAFAAKRARVSLTLRLICGYLLRSLLPFLKFLLWNITGRLNVQLI